MSRTRARVRRVIRQRQAIAIILPPIRVKGDISLHCDTRGNYELWQCDEGRCWCVDAKTGAATSNVVAEELARFLPCYSESKGAYQVGTGVIDLTSGL